MVLKDSPRVVFPSRISNILVCLLQKTGLKRMPGLTDATLGRRAIQSADPWLNVTRFILLRESGEPASAGKRKAATTL